MASPPTNQTPEYTRKRQISGLLADTGKLSDILKYHVVKLFVKDKEHIRSFRLSNKVPTYLSFNHTSNDMEGFTRIHDHGVICGMGQRTMTCLHAVVNPSASHPKPLTTPPFPP